jgi:hypothetical protein
MFEVAKRMQIAGTEAHRIYCKTAVAASRGAELLLGAGETEGEVVRPAVLRLPCSRNMCRRTMYQT